MRAEGEATLDEVRREIYAILRTQTGHEFGGYKTKTFLRRVQRRLQIRQLDTTEAYLELLRQEPQEVAALFRDLLINVTNFFRDAEAFESLAELVVPKLFEGRGADDTIRVWVPGCATGEEVFSIGMLLREHMDQLTVAAARAAVRDRHRRAGAVRGPGRRAIRKPCWTASRANGGSGSSFRTAAATSSPRTCGTCASSRRTA